MKTAKYIPNNLLSCRKAVNLRQLDVAAKLGFTTTDRISRWEKGQAHPNIFNLFKLAKIYNVPPEKLYEGLIENLSSYQGPENQNTPEQVF